LGMAPAWPAHRRRAKRPGQRRAWKLLPAARGRKWSAAALGRRAEVGGWCASDDTGRAESFRFLPRHHLSRQEVSISVCAMEATNHRMGDR
jgi:hypothetical protein